ncbi:MAG: molybdopterin molybdotransferase MoeA [Actinomycetota bacterium]|nr:molybdopterin molybdotransferase MoeA [Actinomycetota bacterium]
MAPTLITVAQARALVLSVAGPLGAEPVPVPDALDRVLTGEVRAAGPVPPLAVSAMDGYAVSAGEAPRVLEVVGESRAGTPAVGVVAPGTAARISTGAVIPGGAEAVIRQEDVRSAGAGRIELRAPVAPGANIRRAGEDIEAGARVLGSGALIGPAELAVAVAAGAGELLVSRRPAVSVLCTGDELRAPGEPLPPGAIHNSNGPMLSALARRCGAQVEPVLLLRDDRDATETGLAAALDRSEVVIISGGVSVGPHDHVKPALAALGAQEVFWGVALQPGKPTWFGTHGDTLVFGLPGNPVSAAVTFTLFAWPVLRAMLGLPPADAPAQSARLGVPVARNPARQQALRVRLERDAHGLTASPAGPQASHIISSLLGAQALALIPAGEGELAAGSEVSLHPLPL